MNKYNFNNCQVGAAGDGATAENPNFTIEEITRRLIDENIDIVTLEKEINELKKQLDTKENKNMDECKLLLDVAEIQKYIREKDMTKTKNKINSSSSNLFKSMAAGIGSGVLTNLLSNVFGITK